MNTIKKHGPLAARLFLGFIFAVFGLNKLVPFLPEPQMTGAPAQFFGALFATGYMIPLLALTEITAGLLLLSGRYVPLGLT
ncbi:MAG: DoxX family membrane protein, partial [Polyangiaceae bacterium]